MGADLKTYVVYGFACKMEELKKRNLSIYDEKYLPYSEGHRGIIDILIPDNSGKYFIFGRRLSHLDAEDNKINIIDFENSSIYSIDYSSVDFNAETDRLRTLFIELFGNDVFSALGNGNYVPVLMHFNHWS